MTHQPLPRGPFAVILADPAWSYITYNGSGTPHRTKKDHYPVMTLDELKLLEVSEVAAKDCVLIMWVIGSHLDQALELGRSWGFTYKSDLFYWIKIGKSDPSVRPIGMGKWTRKQVETALIFTRGNPKRLDAGVRQLIETEEHLIYAARREHSRKPDQQYERIERLCAGPFLEMFARTQRSGWESWGNETTKFAELDPLLAPAAEMDYQFLLD